MSSRSGANSDEIMQYIERLREERRLTDISVQKMEREKSELEGKIEEFTKRKKATDARLQAEKERAERQDRGLKEVSI
uniref:Uncharacterized protein n=1 Tax=Caenorhabditis japonica TaxID=281687 RepID=A0A8R1E884_CAEJA